MEDVQERNILFGCRLEQETAEEVTHQKIDPEIFDLCPSGNLIFVCVEKTPKKYGLIEMVPQFSEPPGCGYIIAAGPSAGQEPPRGGVAAIGVVSQKPSDLLGLHVVFGAHTGVPIRVNMTEARYNGQVFMMSSRDVQCIDLNPVPLGDRIQDKLLLAGQERHENLIVESN